MKQSDVGTFVADILPGWRSALRSVVIQTSRSVQGRRSGAYKNGPLTVTIEDGMAEWEQFALAGGTTAVRAGTVDPAFVAQTKEYERRLAQAVDPSTDALIAYAATSIADQEIARLARIRAGSPTLRMVVVVCDCDPLRVWADKLENVLGPNDYLLQSYGCGGRPALSLLCDALGI